MERTLARINSKSSSGASLRSVSKQASLLQVSAEDADTQTQNVHPQGTSAPHDHIDADTQQGASTQRGASHSTVASSAHWGDILGIDNDASAVSFDDIGASLGGSPSQVEIGSSSPPAPLGLHTTSITATPAAAVTATQLTSPQPDAVDVHCNPLFLQGDAAAAAPGSLSLPATPNGTAAGVSGDTIPTQGTSSVPASPQQHVEAVHAVSLPGMPRMSALDALNVYGIPNGADASASGLRQALLHMLQRHTAQVEVSEH